MFICFVDESGDSGTFNPTDPLSNPYFIVCGLITNVNFLPQISIKFIQIKAKYFPNQFSQSQHFLDKILIEIKGNDLRKDLRGNDIRKYKNSIGFITAILNLLNEFEVKLLCKCFVKGIKIKNTDSGLYGSAFLYLCEHFNRFANARNDSGIIIADSRRKAQNTRTSHSIYTQLLKRSGNSFPNIIHPPLFCHSNNSSMIQMTDIICSALIFPMVADVFNIHLLQLNNVHLSFNYTQIRLRFKDIIKRLQYNYQDDGFWKGGINVKDISKKNGKTGSLFNNLNLPAIIYPF